jgi:hypothetical protein
MSIRLTSYELALAASVGSRRQVAALKDGRPDRHGFEGLGWDVHIEGAAGELALAKYMKWYWNGSVDTFREMADVGAVEVRTRSRHTYELLVRPDDSDDVVYVLVTGRAPEYAVRGWMLGRDAKRPEWFLAHGDRPRAYFVPHAALRPMDALAGVVA